MNYDKITDVISYNILQIRLAWEAWHCTLCLVDDSVRLWLCRCVQVLGADVTEHRPSRNMASRVIGLLPHAWPRPLPRAGWQMNVTPRPGKKKTLSFMARRAVRLRDVTQSAITWFVREEGRSDWQVSAKANTPWRQLGLWSYRNILDDMGGLWSAKLLATFTVFIVLASCRPINKFFLSYILKSDFDIHDNFDAINRLSLQFTSKTSEWLWKKINDSCPQTAFDKNY